MKRPRLEDDSALGARIAAWTKHAHWRDLSQEVLSRIAADEGVDFATALLYARIRNSAEHGPCCDSVETIQDAPGNEDYKKDVLFGIVPGAFYRQHLETGADGRKLREALDRLGFSYELIPVESIGTVRGNASIIGDWLARQVKERPIILVSLSKGGAEIKMALSMPGTVRNFENVAAWMNIGNVLNGSPMITWLRERPWCMGLYRLIFFLQRRNFGFVLEMDRGHDSLLAREVELPEHVKLYHVSGFPLARHMSTPRAAQWRQRLSHLGPNDSVSLLSDLCALPGTIIPVFGTDHYFQPDWDIGPALSAILRHVHDELQHDGADEFVRCEAL